MNVLEFGGMTGKKKGGKKDKKEKRTGTCVEEKKRGKKERKKCRVWRIKKEGEKKGKKKNEIFSQ